MTDMDKGEEMVPPVRQKKISEKILSVSTSVLLVLAILICFTVIYQIQTRRFVSIFGFSVFRVVSDSMEPEIPVGALLISHKTDIAEIEKGDIICFRSLEPYMYGQVVTHRVVGIGTNEDGEIFLRTRGDSNTSEDGFYVNSLNLIGKAVYYTGEDSLLMNTYAILTSGPGFFTLIVIPILVIAVFVLQEYISGIKKELKKMKEELIREELSANASENKEETENIHRSNGEKTDSESGKESFNNERK